MSAASDRELLARLSRLYPRERLLRSPAELVTYESDALTAFRARPRAAVLPESRQEVIETIRLCHHLGVPFVARGSGTSLSGGSLPVEDGIVIALNRLNRLLKLDPLARVAVVEPGVVNLDVSRAAAPHGLYYAPDPSSQAVCTIGGNVAFNSGGAHCLKYGMTSNHVLGLEVVLPDGEVQRLGGESLDGAGPDLVGLYVGSEGLFGVTLEVTLRLLVRPEAVFTLLAAYRSLAAAGDAVAEVIASGLLPGAMEIMDSLAVEAAEAAVGAGYPREAAGLLIVELEGPAAQVRGEAEKLRRVVGGSGAYEIREARDDADRERIWRGRKSAFSAVGRLSPDYLVQDGVVPRTRLGETLSEIERLSQRFGLRVANVFHAGDGNLHPLILYDGRKAGALQRAEELAGEILRLCLRFAGSITGEHGVGVEKREFLAQMYSGDDLAAQQAIRQSLDPAGLSNPGKMFPATVAPAPWIAPPGTAGVVLRPRDLAELQEAVRSEPRLLPIGGGSKSSTAGGEAQGWVPLELGGLTGVLDYQPQELTLTALAGTPVREVEVLLAAAGQYLPFDPLTVGAGATLGGTVAAAASGPGTLRYGGVRDFLIGVRYVDGAGRLVRGGGRVVKNAAGFDLPKLMVGSLGRLGVLGELTFKVFPAPLARLSLTAELVDFDEALQAMLRLRQLPVDLEALDLRPPAQLEVRCAGDPDALIVYAELVQAELGGRARQLEEDEAELHWRQVRELDWVPPEATLVRVPVTPGRVSGFESRLRERRVLRRYSGACQQLLVAWSEELAELGRALAEEGLAGAVLRGSRPCPALGVPVGAGFGARIKEALDPEARFPPLVYSASPHRGV